MWGIFLESSQRIFSQQHPTETICSVSRRVKESIVEIDKSGIFEATSVPTAQQALHLYRVGLGEDHQW